MYFLIKKKQNSKFRIYMQIYYPWPTNADVRNLNCLFIFFALNLMYIKKKSMSIALKSVCKNVRIKINPTIFFSLLITFCLCLYIILINPIRYGGGPKWPAQTFKFSSFWTKNAVIMKFYAFSEKLARNILVIFF